MSGVSDSIASPILLGLRDCLRAELPATALGPACRAMVLHSMNAPIMDGCDCECTVDGRTGNGDTWARLVRMDPDVQLIGLSPQACPTGWQLVIEIGTYRCGPVSEDGSPLPERDLTDFALALGEDRMALLRVFDCCPVLRDTHRSVDFYQPVGPTGGCYGGVLQFRVAVSGGGC